MSDSPSPLGPETGQNLFGIATLQNGKQRPVKIIFYDETINFYHCVDVETGEKFRFHSHQIKITNERK
jgi:hypothetical protein